MCSKGAPSSVLGYKTHLSKTAFNVKLSRLSCTQLVSSWCALSDDIDRKWYDVIVIVIISGRWRHGAAVSGRKFGASELWRVLLSVCGVVQLDDSGSTALPRQDTR